ncbi:MAG: hypothetical protein ACJ76Z_07330 [Thermoleophilaceae bacterium]
MRRRAPTVRAIALVAAGSAALHQLRYAIGYGRNSAHELAVQGHAYLALVLPLVAAVAILALAAALRRIARRPVTSRGVVRLASLWAASSCALALVYVAQESVEGLVVAGHAAGFAAFAGGSAWIGLALAVPIGLLVALGVRGSAAAHEALAGRVPRPPALPRARVRLGPKLPLLRARRFARGLGARGPPRSSLA